MSAVSRDREIESVEAENEEAAEVYRLATDAEPWPLDQYDEEHVVDWGRIVSMWIAVALGFVEVMLSFRLGFKLAGANTENGFVNFVYDVTKPLVAPFLGIVNDNVVGATGVFEGSTMVAMLAYLIGAILVMAVAWAAVATAGEAVEAYRSSPSRRGAN
jgi:hypothetical protein